jgi:aminoglycoside phosphotransferase (APT) family kinase protein
LLTEFLAGEPYAQSLRRVADGSSLEASDELRVDRLVEYLVALHAETLSQPFARERALRDLFGSGEGIFGIVDGYPQAAPGVSEGQLRRLEALCGDWRWRLKRIERPLVRTHGDFHPFNVLFDDADQPVLLDASRGCAGEPADDVTCMALNYPFFALERSGTWPRFSVLWYRFWSRYLELSEDDGVLRVAAPFLAWRALVLASPLWYPKLSADARTRLLAFAESALSTEAFAPESVERMFR